MVKTPLRALLSTLTLALAIPLSAQAAPANAPADTNALPIDSLRLFAEAFERIKQNYVKEVSDQQLIQYAIQGMVSNLDPHSSYLSPDDFRDLQESTSGEFGGLGIEVDQQDGLIRVVSPIDDTPAQKAGIKAGDMIIKVDGQAVSTMNVNDAINLMRGKPGSKVTLTLMREGVTQPIVKVLERAVIRVKSVKYKLYDDSYGYVRITQFQEDSGDEVVRALKRLKDDAKSKGLRGVVLDLRNNPGGVLQAAVEVAGAFLDGGLVVYTQGRGEDEGRADFDAKPGDLTGGVPLVVLINGGSASASEIVAGALQDRKRGVILGEPSFGKGSVQTIMPLGSDSAIKLTTALYFTPNGRSIQAEGITPDIRVNDVKVTPVAEQGVSIKEADLKGHLNNAGGNVQNNDQSISNLIESDYPLFESFNLLKALSLAKR
ncbi:peptidase S41 [Pokkaliibacter plantistimulans]|uniref:Peptidase S41 n=1 Tax=Pokkaliibacter plantistimulans TaxID=1635171 RepID=A0ABX5M1L6_9GAMM|nr:S41 family peptidase [Pokkaliibacter plantistimulans]PXF32264.1 peptidase S41 [Pokkaliibacter plantistimulans]